MFNNIKKSINYIETARDKSMQHNLIEPTVMPNGIENLIIDKNIRNSLENMNQKGAQQ